MPTSIRPHIAQQIVEAIKDVCEHDINFIDTKGFIFASTNKKRIGNYHEIGREAARTAATIEVEQDNPSLGIQKGVNIPFVFQGEVLAVIGISGSPVQVRKYARLAQGISSLILREHELEVQEQLKKAKLHQLIRALIHNEYVNSGYLQESLEKYGIRTDGEYRTVLIKRSAEHPASDASDISALENSVYQAFHQTESPLHTSLFSNEYILLLNSDCLEKSLPVFQQLTQKYPADIKIGIGKSAVLTRQHQSYHTAVLSLNSLFGQDSIAIYDDLTLELLLGSISEEPKSYFLSKTSGMLDDKMKELLKVYFSSNNSLKDTCNKLYIHKNTLQYQLDRIHRITGFNPRNFKDAVVLYMALKLESAF